MALVIVRSVVNTDAYTPVLLTVLFTHFALTFCPHWCHIQQYSQSAVLLLLDFHVPTLPIVQWTTAISFAQQSYTCLAVLL